MNPHMTTYELACLVVSVVCLLGVLFSSAGGGPGRRRVSGRVAETAAPAARHPNFLGPTLLARRAVLHDGPPPPGGPFRGRHR